MSKKSNNKKKMNDRSRYLSLPIGQLLDALWVMQTVEAMPPMAVAALTKQAELAGFGGDMLENTMSYFAGILTPSKEADEVRDELADQYIEARTNDVMRDIARHDSVASEVRGLVKELAARLSAKEMVDELRDMTTPVQPRPEQQARQRVWVRAGDGDEYHGFETLRQAAEYLRDTARIQMPADLVGEMSVEAHNFQGNDYISLYWGVKAEAPTRSVTREEWEQMVEVIG